MPFVEVWVEPTDCGPCPDCELRKAEEEQADADLLFLAIEWVRAKDMGDMDQFEQALQKVVPRYLDLARYGDRFTGLIPKVAR